MVDIESPGPTISEDQVLRLEADLGVRLPEDYRKFLLHNNGGTPELDTVDVPNAPGSPTDVQVFFGISRDVESSNLDWNRQTFRDRIPAGFLPVATDSGGNLFCLALANNNAAKIFYCDIESPDGNAYPVASSFDAFLRRLRPFD
jgi:cell wall assembly regulator SMI1